jgi:hypothetical protein
MTFLYLPYEFVGQSSIAFHEAGSNVIALDDGKHENPSITDFSAACCGYHNFHDVLNAVVVNDNLDHHFRQ